MESNLTFYLLMFVAVLLLCAADEIGDWYLTHQHRKHLRR